MVNGSRMAFRAVSDEVAANTAMPMGVYGEYAGTYTFALSEDYPLDYRNSFSPKVPYPSEGFPPYYQVFDDRQPFMPNLSIIDLLFNLGPEAKDYLKRIT